MKLALFLLLALVGRWVLTSPHFPWWVSACQPVMLAVVGAARKLPPPQAGWFGLVAGLAADLVDGTVVGPRGIALAVAAVVTSTLGRLVELSGPLFWIVGTALGFALAELTQGGVLLSLGAPLPHGLVGGAVGLALTTACGLAVAAGEGWWRRLTSPANRRRRALKRL